MVGLKTSSDAVKEVIQLLGLTENQGKIYFSVLSLGTATLGQISLLSGLDYLKTQDALEVLVGSNLVRRIPGKVGRYVALSPFLKTFLLAYDPITLVNIWKESSTGLQAQVARTAELVTQVVDTFGQRTSQLEADFSQSLEPVQQNFATIVDSVRGLINTTEQQIQVSAQKLQSTSNQLVSQSEKFLDEIKRANIEKIQQIPEVFQPFIPQIEEALATMIHDTKTGLDTVVSSCKADLKNLQGDISTQLGKKAEDIDILLRKFENDRKDEEETFLNKVKETKTALNHLRESAVAKKTHFKEIRDGYAQIDKTIARVFKELDNKLVQMEPSISSTMVDIQGRKMFRGKDEFLDVLSQIENARKSIQEDLNIYSEVSEKINGFNGLLDETEEEIVNATETGITQVETILDEESQSFSSGLQEMITKVSTTDRPQIQEIFGQSQKSVQSQTRAIESALELQYGSFHAALQNQSRHFMTELRTLIDTTANDFIREIEIHYESSGMFDAKTTGLGQSIQELDNMASRPASELTEVLTQVAHLQESFSHYISRLNASLSKFADTQLEVFAEALNKTQELLNSQIKSTEKQLEQEISAITFSIRQMKQNLNKIVQTSQLSDISGIDPTLLSTDLVVGEPVVIMLLRDLTVRAKSSLTILMPRPELQTLIQASKLPFRTRVSIIGDFRKVPRSTLKKILSAGNTRLKQLDVVDYWACIRDTEEMLICPEPKDPAKEELIGVISTNENLVELFSQEVMTYTTRSREILPQDIK